MRRRSYTTMHDINVTNLVDVIMVLLIVFMISAPLLQSGIKIDLPKTTYVETDMGEGVIVTVTAKDSLGIFIGTGKGDELYTGPQRFEESLKQYLSKSGSLPVYLRADRNVRWEVIIDVIGKIKKQGISEVGLVTAPYETPRKF